MTGIALKRRFVGERSAFASSVRSPERRSNRQGIPVASAAKTRPKAPGRRSRAKTDLCVVGLGYIGLPTAAVFAAAGLSVLGVDVDPGRVANVNAGKSDFGEDGLDTVLAQAVAQGRLRAADRPVSAKAYIIAVPTPLSAGKQPDLRHVHAAADAIAPFLSAGALVVLESTVPIGATASLAAQLSALRPDLRLPGDPDGIVDVLVAHCPERVLPGQILTELRQNDRVIGGLDDPSAVAAADLFGQISTGACHITDAATAEMTKLAENAYRDVNIAYANELATIAEAQGIDPRAVIALANRHPRVDILNPGPGVGGHCIAVDPWFLAASARGRARMIPMARTVNDARPSQIAAQVSEMTDGMKDPVIACFGLAYKRDVADLRESPAVEVVRLLAGLHPGRVLAVEPNIRQLPPELAIPAHGVALVDADCALAEADIAVLLVDHTDFAGMARDLHGKKWVDTRGLWTNPASRHEPIGNCVPAPIRAVLSEPATNPIGRLPSLHRVAARAVNQDRAPVRQ